MTRAFEELRVKDYDAAIASFRAAATAEPRRTDIRKNLAYTLLKTGDSEAAREQFGEAMRIDPADSHVALEYAFLCFETVGDAPARKAEARRIFLQVSKTGDPTATATFRNVDEPLAAGIARWQKVLASSKPTFSAHFELAQLAEARDELELAAANYRAAFLLSPERKAVLLDLARVEKARANTDGMMAALIAATRGGEPRAAELAREKMPERYPYVYEFRNALALDGRNKALHLELAYLLQSMGLKADADAEFEKIAAEWPVRTADPSNDARALGEKSYQAGFLKDAKRYFEQAHEQDPKDMSIDLKLGWTNNMLHDDVTAMRWFDLARESDDPAVASEARKAYANLRASVGFLRTTVWVYPLYSSRWRDVFGYGQVKTEFRQKRLPVHFYASLRLAGDERRTTGGPSPQSLSESAFIVGAGVATNYWHGAVGWFEAGEMIRYLNGSSTPDYRGGVSWARTWGESLAAEKPGWFHETTADAVYVSHFDNDQLFYTQNRDGYTAAFGESRVQPFWANNITMDLKRQYWANSFETGPGVRFRYAAMPASMWVTVAAVRGIFLTNLGNVGKPNFNDFRIGVWYAVTR